MARARDEGGKCEGPPNKPRERPGGKGPTEPLDCFTKVVRVDNELEQTALWHRVVAAIVTLNPLLGVLTIDSTAPSHTRWVKEEEAKDVCLAPALLVGMAAEADKVRFSHFVEDEPCNEQQESKEEAWVVEVTREIAGTADKVGNEVVEEQIGSEVDNGDEH